MTARHTGTDLTRSRVRLRPVRTPAIRPVTLVEVARHRAVGLRTPPGAWRWWETLAVGAAVALVIGALALVDTDITATEFGRNTTIVGHTFALAASVLLYLHWRIAGGGPLSWLVLGMTAMSIHALAMAGLAAGDPQRVVDRPGMVLLTRLVIAVGVLGVVAVARRGAVPDPLAAGVFLGASLFIVRYVVLVLTPHLDLAADKLDRLSLTVFLLDVTIGVGIAVFPRAPRWVRYRIALAVVAVAVANAAAYPVPVDEGQRIPLVVLGHVVGATILLSLSIALVRLSLRDNRKAMGLLREQLLRSEAIARSEQAQLHEIRATMAGISSATQIISGYQAIAPARRASINDMITAEIGRLERLTSPAVDESVHEVDLDTTFEPLVARLAVQGHQVGWARAGHVVLGRADDVAAIVSVLLDNAVRHGGGRSVLLDTWTFAGWTEITVSDHGPGVPRSLREHVFDWGRSGAASTGEGIGLNVARALSEDLGGSLELLDTSEVGATFVLRLPAPGPVAS